MADLDKYSSHPAPKDAIGNDGSKTHGHITCVNESDIQVWLLSIKYWNAK